MARQVGCVARSIKHKQVGSEVFEDEVYVTELRPKGRNTVYGRITVVLPGELVGKRVRVLVIVLPDGMAEIDK